MSNDDGEVVFLYELIVEGRPELSDDVGISGEEDDAASGAVDPVQGVNVLADLIPKDLHRDLIIRVRMIGRMDELSGWFVDRDQEFIAVENLKRHYRLRVRPVFRRGPLFLSLGFLC